MKKERAQLYIVTALAFYAFFIFGFTDNLKGPVIPELLKDLQISYTQGSNILLMAYIGFMAAILAAGYIAARKGNRIVLIIAGIAVAGGAAGNALGSAPALLFATFGLLGFGIGSIEIGANGIIARMYEGQSGKYLNLLSVFHGAGSMVAPFFAGWLISGGTQWRTVYAFVVPLALLQALLMLIFHRPDGDGSHAGAPSREKTRFSELFTRNLVLYAIILTFYVAVEIGVASWMVDFLLKDKGYAVRIGSIMLSAYFGFMMVGRFIGSFVVEHIGYRRALLLVTVTSLVTLLAGILLPAALAFLIPLTGLFFSIVFPTATADAAAGAKAPVSAVFSVLFFCAGLGGMIGPWLMGVVADIAGIRGGFLVSIFFIAVMLVSLLLVKPAARKTGVPGEQEA